MVKVSAVLRISISCLNEDVYSLDEEIVYAWVIESTECIKRRLPIYNIKDLKTGTASFILGNLYEYLV